MREAAPLTGRVEFSTSANRPAIRVFGHLDRAQQAAIGERFVALVDAVAGEIDPRLTGWRIDDWKLECDGCERQVPWEPWPVDWLHVCGEDLCPPCAVARATP